MSNNKQISTQQLYQLIVLCKENNISFGMAAKLSKEMLETDTSAQSIFKRYGLAYTINKIPRDFYSKLIALNATVLDDFKDDKEGMIKELTRIALMESGGLYNPQVIKETLTQIFSK